MDINIIPLNNLNSEDKSYLYTNIFSISCFPTFKKKMILISLICKLTQAFRKQGKKITCKEIIYKLLKDKLSTNILDSLSCICNDFYVDSDTYPTFGIDNKLIVKAIIQISNDCLPF